MKRNEVFNDDNKEIKEISLIDSSDANILDTDHISLADPASPEAPGGLVPLRSDEEKNTNSEEEFFSDDSDAIVSKPIKILVGHQSEISKNDLKAYLIAKANEGFIKEITFISIRKSASGFYWEMHEGGSGKGMLTSVLKALETQDAVYLPSEDRALKITRTNNGGIKALLQSESSNPELTKNIVAQDKMVSLSSSGNGLLFFGMVSVAFSMMALLMAFFIKYSVINKQESVEATRTISATPISEVQKLRETVKLEGIYVESMVLSGDGKYLIKTATEKIETPSVHAKTDTEINKNNDENQENLDKNSLGEPAPLAAPAQPPSTQKATETIK